MNKATLLYMIDSVDQADAVEIAEALKLDYSAAAMALLRLVRQDLANRYIDPETQRFVYEITPKGEERLVFFLEGELDDC